MKTPVVHWTSKNRCNELDGTTSIWISAACRSLRPGPKNKMKLGIREAVTCKTCIRMRDALKKRQSEEESTK